MTYFKINDIDFSKYVNSLDIMKTNNYSSQTNAAGNTVVDYINSKRTINVGIIPLDNAGMIELMNTISNFNVSVSFRNPATGALEEGVNCIIPSNDVSYYTIQDNKVLYNTFVLSFIEL